MESTPGHAYKHITCVPPNESSESLFGRSDNAPLPHSTVKFQLRLDHAAVHSNHANICKDESGRREKMRPFDEDCMPQLGLSDRNNTQ